MKRSTVFFALFLVMGLRLHAQTVVGSSGINVSSPTGSVVWTVGEPAVITFTTANNSLTQGFHQPNEATLKVVSVTDLGLCAGESFNLTYSTTGVFPAGTVYTAELSDAFGSFLSPAAIGSATTPLAGIIGATIPVGAAAGSGYKVRVSAAGLSSAAFDQNLTVFSSPQIGPISTGDAVSFCAGGSALLQVPSFAGYSYQWYRDGLVITGATAPSIVATLSGDYTVEGFNPNGCAGASAPFAIQVFPSPTVAVSALSQTNLCQGQNVTLATPTVSGATYQWLLNGVNIAGANSASYVATLAGSYTLRLTDANGCFNYSSPVSVSVGAVSPAFVTPSGTVSTCVGTPVSLAANTGAGFSYQWYFNGIPVAFATTDVLTATQAGSYAVEITNAGGCATLSSATILTNNLLPSAVIAPSVPQTICAGQTLTFNAATGTGFAYQWFRDGVAINGANGVSLNASQSGAYSVQVTDANQCSAVSPASALSVVSLPSVAVSLSGSSVLCHGQTAVLSVPAQNGGAYQWYANGFPIQNAVSNVYTASLPGNYSVQVFNNANCSNFSTETQITVLPLPNVSVSAVTPTTFCSGENVMLQGSVNVNYQYQWFRDTVAIPAALNADYVATESGIYILRVTEINGCQSFSAPVLVTVLPLPSVTILSNETDTLCNDQTAVLSVQSVAGYLYQWQKDGVNLPGQNQTSLTVDETGDYTVAVTNPANCQSVSQAAHVEFIEVPAAMITADGPTNICQGASVTLNASLAPGFSYQWMLDGANIVAATSPTFVASQAGIYTVKIYSPNGCFAFAPPVVVQVQTLPVINIGVNGSTTACGGSAVQFFATTNTGLAYQWQKDGQNIAGADGSQFAATESGVYTVVAYAFNGCFTVSNPVSANILPLAELLISPNPAAVICENNQVTLKVESAVLGDYQWYFNNNPVANSNATELIVSTPGLYRAEMTDANGCVSSSATTEVSANPLPQPVVLPAGETSVCAGQSVTLLSSVNSPDYLYQWQFNDQNVDGANSPSFVALNSGNYRIIVSNNGQCVKVSDRLFVEQWENPIPPTILLQDGFLNVAPVITGIAYQWYFNGFPIGGANNPFYSPESNFGDYTVLATNFHGCAALSDTFSFNGTSARANPSDAFDLTVYPNPVRVGEILRVQANFAIAASVEIALFDAQGRLIWSKNESAATGEQTLSLPTVALSAGLYHLQIAANGQRQSLKISVVK